MTRLRAAILALLLGGSCLHTMGQTTEVLDERIRTFSFTVNGQRQALPVVRLGSDDVLEYSFDHLSAEYRRYTYRVEHVGADFGDGESLLESDYLRRHQDDLVIDDYAPSLNTTVGYTHYAFSVPNVRLRPTLSGNYRLTIYADEEEGLVPVVRTYFMVSEEKASSLASATTDTDIDRNDRHQQLQVEVNYSQLQGLRAPDEEVKIIVVKNGQWDEAVRFPQPTGQTGYALLWRHCRELIFPAGSEYRKFELSSTQAPGMHVESIRYYEPFYHATLMGDAPRPNYLYDEDQNGRFVALAGGAGLSAATEADYVWVHFSLHMPQLPEGASVRVYGLWSEGNPATGSMTYNDQLQAYETALLLKQGYYSYRYAVSPSALNEEVEGNFWQTENEYAILVYYCQRGSRYDRLVGYRTASFWPR